MIPAKLRHDLIGHTVRTIPQAGWKGLKNGALLSVAQEQFEAFITMDSSLPFTQKLDRFTLRFIIVHGINNTIEVLRPLGPDILKALNHVEPGQVVHVPEHA
jgi:hypothetical protein